MAVVQPGAAAIAMQQSNDKEFGSGWEASKIVCYFSAVRQSYESNLQKIIEFF